MCGVCKCASATLIPGALAGRSGASDNSTKGGHLFKDPALSLSIKHRRPKLTSDRQVLEELKNASTGLLVMSESDYPFELIQWSGETAITPEYLCGLSDRPAGTRIEETDTKRFLGEHERFRKLQAVIEGNLADVKVYKVGTINIPVYIVGRSLEGNWLGVSTRLIQT